MVAFPRIPNGNRAMTSDALGARMKAYEACAQLKLPRRTYTILRVDGRMFHTLTRDLDRPYDVDFAAAMNAVAITLCQKVQNARLAYVQSDEVSVLLTDFTSIETQPWFEGNIQKQVSISACIAANAFNRALGIGPGDAEFDARVFTIPDPTEVENYFIWRQKDAERNSLAMVAQYHASHQQLLGVNAAGQHDIIHAAGDNWNDYPVRFKRGGIVIRVSTPAQGAALHGLVRMYWGLDDPPIFTEDRTYLRTRIPVYE